jgi:hypothetical protein
MSKYTSNAPTTRPPADPQAAKRTASKQDRTVEKLVRECIAEAHGNPERAIALGRLRLREIYLAQVKKAEARYFDGIKRAAIGSALLRETSGKGGTS